MKFMAISNNVRDVSEFVAAEFGRLDELEVDGTLLGGWLKADFSGAVLLIESENEAQARAVLATLPTAQNGATVIDLMAVIDLHDVERDTTSDPI